MLELKSSDPLFPQVFLELQKPPKIIYYCGRKDLLKAQYISVVGAREPHPWILEWMEHEIAPILKKYQIGIVSGGARGVDQLAHRIAIRCGQPTLIVVPSGLNRKYPTNLGAFQNQPNVGFLSEYSSDQQMRKHHFYRRNHLIAALTPVTLVVQASEKSGTIITAKYALDLGRQVGALPGTPVDSFMTGNNQLLFDGAQMVRHKSDLDGLLSSIFVNSNFSLENKMRSEQEQEMEAKLPAI